MPTSAIPVEMRIIQNERELRFRALELQRQLQEANHELLKPSWRRQILNVALVRIEHVAVLVEPPIRPS